MKKKELSYLNEVVLKKDIVDDLMILLNYFTTAKSVDTNFSNWSERISYFNYYLIDCVLLNGERKTNENTFSAFVNNSIKSRKLDENRYDDYFNLINTIDENKYPNLVFFLKDFLLLLAKNINVDLLKSYFPNYPLTYIDDVVKKYEIRDMSFEAVIEKKELRNKYQSFYHLNQKLMMVASKDDPRWIDQNFLIPKDMLDVNKIIEKLNSIDLKINNISECLCGKSYLDIELFKKVLNSIEKGNIGEHLFSNSIGGDVVGYLGNKTDVVLEDKKYSVKTTYGNSWNNHLAYISDNETIKLFLENKRMSKLAKMDKFNELILSFFNGKENLEALVLQKIKMDELGHNVLEASQYHVPMKVIEENIQQKNYFFNNNELILTYKNEQYLKIAIKERSTNLQVMILVNPDSLSELIDAGIVVKKDVSDIEKNNIKKFKS